MLREQRGRCRDIKGEPQNISELRKPKATLIFFLWVWFYDGPWQTEAVYQIWSP